jgi:hypothetical protein
MAEATQQGVMMASLFGGLRKHLGRLDGVTQDDLDAAVGVARDDAAAEERRLKEAVEEAWEAGKEDFLQEFGEEGQELLQRLDAQLLTWKNSLLHALATDEDTAPEPEEEPADAEPPLSREAAAGDEPVDESAGEPGDEVVAEPVEEEPADGAGNVQSAADGTQQVPPGPAGTPAAVQAPDAEAEGVPSPPAPGSATSSGAPQEAAEEPGEPGEAEETVMAEATPLSPGDPG